MATGPKEVRKEDEDQATLPEIHLHNYYGQRIWEYYLRINKKYGAARADLLRYLVLYALGGVYLDLKSTVLYPLSLNIQQGDSFLIMYWDCFSGGKNIISYKIFLMVNY